jgi:hypothetical protein
MESQSKTKRDVRLDAESKGYQVLLILWLPAQARAIQDALEIIARSIATLSTFCESVDSSAGKSNQPPIKQVKQSRSALSLRFNLLDRYVVIDL